MLLNEILAVPESIAAALGEYIKARGVDGIKVANKSVEYQVLDNGVGLISIDGALNKKGMQGLCMRVYGYDDVIAAIDAAENDPKVDTIMFRVDSPGGSVAGLEDLRLRILESRKPTITLYENLGASAALYAFTAADEIYATPTAQLGSVGVIGMFQVSDEAPVIVMTSSNAPNKTCDLGDEACVDRMQAQLDRFEQYFYQALEENIGYDAEKIKSVFNMGDVAFAEDLDFLDGLTTFHALMQGLGTTTASAAVPTALSGDKTANHQPKGESMEVQDELQARLDEVRGELQAAQIAALEALRADLIARVREGLMMALDVETIEAMLKAETPEQASEIALSAQQSQAVAAGNGEDAEVEGSFDFNAFVAKIVKGEA